MPNLNQLWTRCGALVFFAALLPTMPGLAQVGRPAPTLVVPQSDGTTFDLKALRGKVVIVDFWATWCKPCREEIPVLSAFFKKYRDQGLEMIGVSIDGKREARDVPKIMSNAGYSWALMSRASRSGFDMPDELPDTFVIDDDGIVRAIFQGGKPPLTDEALGKIVIPLLPENLPTNSSTPSTVAAPAAGQ